MTDRLLEIRNLEIDGESDEVWHEIIKGLDLDLDRGEVLGLIGESGAGKSTLGLAAMNFVRPGCRIRGGTIRFDGQELTEQSETTLRKLRGVRIAYVAQSAAASFNPAHQLIDQFSEIPVVHNVKNRQEAEADAQADKAHGSSEVEPKPWVKVKDAFVTRRSSLDKVFTATLALHEVTKGHLLKVPSAKLSTAAIVGFATVYAVVFNYVDVFELIFMAMINLKMMTAEDRGRLWFQGKNVASVV